jgi:ribosomal protein S27AE
MSDHERREAELQRRIDGFVAETAALRALLAAQEARAQRVEAALRRVIYGPGAAGGCDDEDCRIEGMCGECLTQADAALSQPADERGHDYENDGNGVCVHCGYKVVPAQHAATGEGQKWMCPKCAVIYSYSEPRCVYCGGTAPPGQSPTTLGREQGK